VTTFRWDPQFETGLEEIDLQHRHLVGLIDALGARLEREVEIDLADLGQTYAELLDYTRYHFKAEEGLMAAAGLDERHARTHHREHLEFSRQVEEMVCRPAGAPESGPRRLLEFLVHWLTYHILGSDQAMGRQVKAIVDGATPAEAWAGAARNVDPATATLLRSVSALFDALSQRNRELTELTDSLEQRVAERTEELTAANAELKHLVGRVEEMAMTDILTGLPNRRYAMETLQRSWAESLRHGRPLACLVIDADGFKQVNDGYGHDAGDQVLKALAAALRAGVRASDAICRLGGDEFLVIAPDTALDGALNLGERLRARIAALRVPAGAGVWHGSISVGVASREAGMADPGALLRAADQGAYAAKRGGKNAVRAGGRTPDGPGAPAGAA
jgi:hemerythrin